MTEYSARIDPRDAEVVEWMDPDWRDHFSDIDEAADFYKRYASDDWAEAIKELN